METRIEERHDPRCWSHVIQAKVRCCRNVVEGVAFCGALFSAHANATTRRSRHRIRDDVPAPGSARAVGMRACGQKRGVWVRVRGAARRPHVVAAANVQPSIAEQQAVSMCKRANRGMPETPRTSTWQGLRVAVHAARRVTSSARSPNANPFLCLFFFFNACKSRRCCRRRRRATHVHVMCVFIAAHSIVSNMRPRAAVRAQRHYTVRRHVFPRRASVARSKRITHTRPAAAAFIWQASLHVAKSTAMIVGRVIRASVRAKAYRRGGARYGRHTPCRCQRRR